MERVFLTVVWVLAPATGIDAQEATGARPPVDASSTDVRSASASSTRVARLVCADALTDLATGTCLEASSTPTFGLFFPYPGTDNKFDPLINSTVGGGENNHASGRRATIGGGGGNIASNLDATVAGGYLNTASGFRATVGGGLLNIASENFSSVAGGIYNAASGETSVVGGGYENTAAGRHATISGGSANEATGERSTIAGGLVNRAAGDFTTIGGGVSHVAGASCSTVAGGHGNRATGSYSAVGGGRDNAASGFTATIGGGADNEAAARWATVGGGVDNTASGERSTVGGGINNLASGNFSTVPGGRANIAEGRDSFAAGHSAMANHEGAFVWGDSQNFAKTSSVADEFSVYCSGGARFFSNGAATTGVLLAPGGGSWSSVSDRDAKENLEAVDVDAILEKVAALPLATWNYKEQADSIRHMGPMAQDFYAAFGLGLGDMTIDTVDPDGVALAAIQGLHRRADDQEQLLAEKDAEIARLRKRLERLEALATRAAK